VQVAALMIVDGYIRVSQVNDRQGERFISPSVQRERIEGWARLHRATVGEVFEELDESGARADRPLLERALARVELGESSGIVVSKLDRFGRSLLDGLAAIDRITRAGGTFVAVEDGLDLSTDTGKLVLRILLSLGEWELDRVRTIWRTAQERAVARGVKVGGTPTGYRRRSDGRLVADPHYAPLVAELFHRRAEGASIGELCRLLNERGVPTAAGAPVWGWSTVDGLLRNRAYLGEIRHGTYLNASGHAALVDPATWQAAQRPLEKRPARPDAGETLLRGLLRCSGCCRMLTAFRIRRGTGRENRLYACWWRGRVGVCPRPVAIQDSIVEPYLEALFWQELERWPRRRSARRLRALEGRAERLEAELFAYRDSERVARTLREERFVEGLEVRQRRHERALLALAAARFELADPGLPDSAELRARWPALGIGERRELIGRLIDCAFVLPPPGSPDRRLVVCGRGQAPNDLPPSAGQWRRRSTRPFDPAECRGSIRLGAAGARRWPEARVRAALDPFLANRASWPTFLEFQSAGLGLVHHQVDLLGGAARWARRYGLRREVLSKSIEAWSTERIRSELIAFLAGRSVWPTQQEFEAAGKATVRRVLNSFGGPDHWAEEFGLELPRTRRRLHTWTDEQIEAELRRFTADRREWPTRLEFEEAGLRSLYGAIAKRGTRRLLARKLGLRLPRQGARVPTRWTDEAIECALREMLRGRNTWPTWKDFRASRRHHLYQAIRCHGGHDRWARRYRLPRVPSPPGPKPRDRATSEMTRYRARREAT
jgi:DNA invertase Pin-like site-specific DNA recombinase